MGMSVCGYMHACADAPKGQKRAPNILELELRVLVCHLIGALETKFELSARARSAFNLRAISSVPARFQTSSNKVKVCL